MDKRVLVAMSGGVDSAVCALILKNDGYEPTGVTFRMYRESGCSCCTEQDIEDAAKISAKLDMEHMVVDSAALFRDTVVRGFAESYMRGETPNPCVECNRQVKFLELFALSEKLGFDHIATGHYAQTEYDEKTGRYLLKKSADITKDQTYVLYALSQAVLKKLILPLGGLKKSEVRLVAEENGFENAKKPDSQDICFVPDGDYAAFIEREFGYVSEPGDFISADGRVLGQHLGHIRYTTGQRRGLGVSADRPLYVLGKNVAENKVILGDDTQLYSKNVRVRDVNLISCASITESVRAEVKIRYSQKTAAAELMMRDDGMLDILFDEPQRAPTPGQSAVFYDGDTVIGGGIICG